MRAGTENISSILGMTKAFEIAYKNLEEESKYIYSLKECMVEKIKKMNFLVFRLMGYLNYQIKV